MGLHHFGHGLDFLHCFLAESAGNTHTQGAVIDQGGAWEERGADLLEGFDGFQGINGDVLAAFGQAFCGFNEKLG